MRAVHKDAEPEIEGMDLCEVDSHFMQVREMPEKYVPLYSSVTSVWVTMTVLPASVCLIR